MEHIDQLGNEEERSQIDTYDDVSENLVHSASTNAYFVETVNHSYNLDAEVLLHQSRKWVRGSLASSH